MSARKGLEPRSLVSLVLLVGVACGGRFRPCEEEPWERVAVTGCDPGSGVVVEDAETFLELCGVEAVDEDFEPIDFDTKLVLGLEAEGSGCTVEFEQEVCRDQDAQVIRYEIFVRSRGTCKKLVGLEGWVAIERPPPDWEIEFDTSEL